MDHVTQEQAPDAAGRGRSAIRRLGRRGSRRAATAGDAAGTSRRSFLRSSGGYATGIAAAVGVPAALLLDAEAEAATTPKVVANPTSSVPAGPVMAYVHDAKKGTVVIMSGTRERTVQDHDLVARLLRAPKKQKARPKRRPALTTNKRG